jgi:hypothetical protein
MKTKEILNKIKEIVGVELTEESVKLAEMKLENGTILVAEAFESGAAIFIKSDEEQIALPVGDYNLEDGRILIVKEEGLIEEIKEAEAEEEVVEEETKEEEMNEETKFVSADEFKTTIDEIKAMIEDLKGTTEETELSTDESNTEITENEAKKEVEEITELSTETKEEEVVEPIKHNPEITEKVNKVLFGQKRTQTTRDRVFDKIANN